MIIDSGSRLALVIEGVFSGVAGVVGDRVAFVPNRFARKPGDARGGVLNGQPVRIAPVKDASGPFWTSRYEVLS